MRSRLLLSIYHSLLNRFGPQEWWPADSEFEVIVGAILTQATGWVNVEKAVSNLKKERLMSPEKIRKATLSRISRIIKPALYHNVKAKKLKAFMEFLHQNYNSNLNLLFNQPKDKLREKLLGVWGIGPETADSIILYAAGKPSFVVDAYTHRIFTRVGLLDGKTGYDYNEIQKTIESNIPPKQENVGVYKEYHALIVELGKRFCRKNKPLCSECPIKKQCKTGKRRAQRHH